jgi:hypothetical protein
MIFKILSLYQKTKHGIHDPKGFALDEIHDAFLGFFLIPGIILVGVTIILGLLAYTSFIAAPSGIAVAFFWLFVTVCIGYMVLVITLRKLLDYVLRTAYAQVKEIKHEVEDRMKNDAN